MGAELDALYALAAEKRFRVTVRVVTKGKQYKVSVAAGRPDWMEPCYSALFDAAVPVDEAIDSLARSHLRHFAFMTQPTRYPSFSRP